VRSLALAGLLALTARAEPAPESSASARDEGAEDEAPALRREPEPSASAAPEPEEPAVPTGRCRPSCCSAEVLELQRQTAVETGDPSIADECCFCDE